MTLQELLEISPQYWEATLKAIREPERNDLFRAAATLADKASSLMWLGRTTGLWTTWEDPRSTAPASHPMTVVARWDYDDCVYHVEADEPTANAAILALRKQIKADHNAIAASDPKRYTPDERDIEDDDSWDEIDICAVFSGHLSALPGGRD